MSELEGGLPTHYWLLSLPIEGRLAGKGKEGSEQVLSVLKGKVGDLAYSTQKVSSLRANAGSPERR